MNTKTTLDLDALAKQDSGLPLIREESVPLDPDALDRSRVAETSVRAGSRVRVALVAVVVTLGLASPAIYLWRTSSEQPVVDASLQVSPGSGLVPLTTSTMPNNGQLSTESTTLTLANSPTSGADPTRKTVAGEWRSEELDLLSARLGVGVVGGRDEVFVWGGASEVTGQPLADGVRIDVDSLQERAVPNAPIEGRLNAAVVWTGSMYVVVGGETFDRRLGDGAVFDPGVASWTVLPELPWPPTRLVAATFFRDYLYVWAPEDDTAYARVPVASSGRFARLSLDSLRWETLPPPPAVGRAAALEALEDTVVLVMGEQFVQYGDPGLIQGPVTALLFDTEERSWGSPFVAPFVADSAGMIVSDDSLVAVSASGSVARFTGSRWAEAPDIDVLCPLDVAVVGGNEAVYSIVCGTSYVVRDGTFLVIDADPSNGGTVGRVATGGVLILIDGPVVGNRRGSPTPMFVHMFQLEGG